MRRVGLGLVVAAVLSAAGLVAVVRADEQEVPLDKLPAAATDAVKKRFPGAELTAAVKDTKKGETIYTITLKHKGSQYDATVAGTGQLKQIEKEIPIKDLPAAVTDAVEAKFPKASIRRAEE